MAFGEESRSENNGLQNIRTLLRTVQAKYNVGYADLVQYAHNHATVTCPRGPRIVTFVGRQDATQAASTGLLPDTNSPAADLIQLFANKGFTAADLAALVGAHTSAKQRFHDTSRANFPLDTTPGTWDVEFYNETLQNPADSSIVVLPSDKAFSTHAQTSPAWNSFVGNQVLWNAEYARTWIKMSLLGVNNLADLRLCTRTLPAAIPLP
jgi:L-ascorbate peroxidase